MSWHPELADDPSRIDAALTKAGGLHSAPPVVRCLLNLTRHADYDIREVAACLEADPALAAKLLRMVNSSRFGLVRPVGNLRQAISLLGQRSLRMVAVTFSLVERLSRGLGAETYQSYWRRSLTMATAAARLADFMPAVQRNDAYSSGLLADLGVLVLMSIHGPRYLQLLADTPHGAGLLREERLQFGCGHAAIGGRLMQKWGFPTTLVEAATHHHDARAQALPLETIVRTSDLLADILWRPASPQLPEARQLLLEQFRLDTDGLIGLAVDCKEEMQSQAELFGLHLDQQIDCDALRQAAEQQREEIAIETALDAKNATPHDQSPLEAYARHLGRAIVQVIAEEDRLGQPADVEIKSLSAFTVTILTEREFPLRTAVRVTVANAAQHFEQELRGVIQSIEPAEGGGYLAAVGLCTLLREPEIVTLRRAGILDRPALQKAWF